MYRAVISSRRLNHVWTNGYHWPILNFLCLIATTTTSCLCCHHYCCSASTQYSLLEGERVSCRCMIKNNVQITCCIHTHTHSRHVNHLSFYLSMLNHFCLLFVFPLIGLVDCKLHHDMFDDKLVFCCFVVL